MLLQNNINGQHHIPAVLRRFFQYNTLHVTAAVNNLNGIAVSWPQDILINPLRSRFSNLTVPVIALAFSFFQLFRRDVLYITGKLGCLFLKRIKPHRSIGNHHSRNLKKLFLELKRFLGNRA